MPIVSILLTGFPLTIVILTFLVGRIHMRGCHSCRYGATKMMVIVVVVVAVMVAGIPTSSMLVLARTVVLVWMLSVVTATSSSAMIVGMNGYYGEASDHQ